MKRLLFFVVAVLFCYGVSAQEITIQGPSTWSTHPHSHFSSAVNQYPGWPDEWPNYTPGWPDIEWSIIIEFTDDNPIVAVYVEYDNNSSWMLIDEYGSIEEPCDLGNSVYLPPNPEEYTNLFLTLVFEDNTYETQVWSILWPIDW